MNTINKLLSVGISSDDTALHGYIADLRQSIVEATQIRPCINNELRLKCDSIIETMTMNIFESIEREFSQS